MKVYHPLRPPFQVSTDFHARLLRIKFLKLWDKETFDGYKQVLLTEMKRFQDAGVTFDMIGDLSEFPPQHQFLNEAREELNALAKQMGLRRCAVIFTSVIVKYQLDRLTSKAYRFFTNEEEALTWIRGKDPLQ